MNKVACLLTATSLGVAAMSAQANHLNQLDDRTYITPKIGFVIGDHTHFDIGPNGHLGIGRPISEKWNIEAGIDHSNYDVTHEPSDYERLAINMGGLFFPKGRSSNIQPFLLGYMSAVRAKFLGETSYSPSFEVGGGILFDLANPNIDLRMDLRYHVDIHRGTPAFDDDTFYQFALNIGAQISFGQPSPPVFAQPTRNCPQPTPCNCPSCPTTTQQPAQTQITPRATPPTPPTMSAVVFAVNSSKLSSANQATLDGVADIMNSRPNIDIDIIGRADDTGPSSYNLELSRERAENVRDYLIAQGIDPSRLNIRAFGEGRPVSSNQTEPGRAQNRRVDFEVR